MKQKTTWTNEKDVVRKWYIIDASDQILGRLSTEVASLLIGKGKVERSPNVDAGDHVIVINSDKIKLSRSKASKKSYFRHSGYPGGAKTITFEQQMDRDSTFVINKAVKNMVPKNKLQSGRLNRLHVYSGTAYKQKAQKPIEYKLSGAK